MKHFHVSATGLSLNYMPQYVAQEHGFFEEVGLAVTCEVPSSWTQVLKDIDAGKAATALGGVWVPAMYHGRGRDYCSFAQISARCPLLLVSRAAAGNFSWSDLEGRVVLVSGTGGLGSYAFLSGLAERAGIDRSVIRFVRDLDYDLLLDMFRGGLGDFMLVDMATADRLLADGVARVAFDLTQDGGSVPWSVYYAPASVLEESPDIYERFRAGLQRGFDWLHSNPVASLAEITDRLWPDYEGHDVMSCLERFRASGMWNQSAEVDPEALAAWQNMLTSAALIERPVPYKDLVVAGRK